MQKSSEFCQSPTILRGMRRLAYHNQFECCECECFCVQQLDEIGLNYKILVVYITVNNEVYKEIDSV